MTPLSEIARPPAETMIANKVQLIVWDLDDSFWKGTLAEGGVAPVLGNIEIVKTLSQRGIVNSICSKNDPGQAAAKLTELGIWEYFVFPSISFNPKGKALAAMIEDAGLRAENVLFIDDNPANLEEAKFFVPGLMVARPLDILDVLLEHPHCAGKPDPELGRLSQYKILQRKAEQRGASALSNEEFLRVSNIQVAIDYDVETNLERVVDLINRANQLNYTKRRLEDRKSLREFRKLLRTYGITSGCVWASDKYGDYGLVGFFMLKRRVAQTRLVHFVFSCRTMNMGIEQYVYELLGQPPIEIAPPVSYGLHSYPAVDWINTLSDCEENRPLSSGKLLMLGGCDLLQLANYCSTNRLEFANLMRDGFQVRFDDPAFILTDRESLRQNRHLLPTWTYEDALRFDEGLASSKLIVLAMYDALSGLHYEIGDAVRVRVSRGPAASRVEAISQKWGVAVRRLEIDLSERTKLVIESFDRIGQKAKSDAQIFLIGYPTLACPSAKKVARRQGFNEACRRYCEGRERFRFVDVDAILPREELISDLHFSPAGYFALAQHILTLSGMSGPALDMRNMRRERAKAPGATWADAVS
jgi:FkbH-like protein